MKNIIKLFIVAIIAICSISCTIVDSGEIGIKYKKFGLTDQGSLITTPVTGYQVYNPFTTSVFTYPAYILRVNYDPFTVTTRDAATFTMDPVLAFYIKREEGAKIFAKYRVSIEEIEAGYMRTCIYDAYRITANKYTSDSLMANRAQFESQVRSMLNRSLGNEGFIVNEFTSQITPPESLAKMIDEKNAAVQQSLKAENEVKKAEAEAKIAIAKAEGEAKSTKIRADAEAYYNHTIAASLSPLIVQEDWIAKWDGKLPQYQLGSNSSMMFNMPK